MDMPFKMYHSIYRSAWLESVAKAKEAEEEEKKMKEDEHKNKKGGNSGQRSKSAGQVIDRIKSLNTGGIDDEDDLAEALGID